MPFFYNGYSSGLKLKTSYAKINHNFTSVQKFAQITNVSVASGNATYTLEDNPFIAGDIVSVSEINGTNQFAFLNKAVSSVSGNNIVFTGFAPTGTYSAESTGSDGTAGVMQLASGISTVSFMAYIDSTTTPATPLNIIKLANNQFSAFTSLTSASYNSTTSATFTYNSTVQLFAIGDIVDITGVTGGSYNKSVTVTAIGGTSGAYTFTATGTGFTNVSGTGGNYIINAVAYVNGVKYNQSSNPLKLSEWQMITLVYTTPFYINNNSSVDIILGDPTTALSTNVYIDQLMIFDKVFTTASGLGSLDNLYNNFVGNIPSNFKSTPEVEITLTDENDLVTSNVQCDHILSSGDIYAALVSGNNSETFTITYKNSKPDLIEKTALLPAATAQKDVYLSDVSSLQVGSDRINADNSTVLGTLTFKGSANTGIAIRTSNDSNGDIPLKIGTVLQRKAKAFSITVNVVDPSNQVEVGNRVRLSGYLDPEAKVTKKVSTATANVYTITILFSVPNKSYKKAQYYGVIKAVPKNTNLVFDGPTPKITFATNLTTAIAKGEKVYFRDKNYSDNLDEREKLKIVSKYIKNEDMILVVNADASKYFLYKVTSGASEAYAIPNGSGITHTVTLTKQALSTSETYSISGKDVYEYKDSKLSKLTPTKLASLQKRVSFKLAPQYAITE